MLVSRPTPVSPIHGEKTKQAPLHLGIAEKGRPTEAAHTGVSLAEVWDPFVPFGSPQTGGFALVSL